MRVTSINALTKDILPSIHVYLKLFSSSHFFRGAHNPNNEFQHGGNVLHSLKMQVVSCFEKNHFIREFREKCRTLNVLRL